MIQDTIDFDKARAERELRRDMGIQTAVDHADVKVEKWSQTAFDYLLAFARRADTFTAEDVRAEAEAAGAVPPPPDKRAWGGIFQRASRAKAIKPIGFVTAKDPKVHCNNIRLWSSCLFLTPGTPQ